MSLTNQLHQAINKSGLSLYAIAKATDTSYSAIHGFARGQRGLTLETADRLAELFGMRLTAPKRRATKTKG
jgi:plasmid maintenance system antidote protein VapI